MHEAPGSDRVPGRITIGIVLFAACCLMSSARLVIDAPRPASVRNSREDVAKRSDQRFSAVKAALPGYGVVGYIGEPGTPALADYYLAQYALAPLVLDRSPNHALVLGNFPDESAPATPSGDLRLVQDFGDGVLLFATKPLIEKDSQTKDNQ